MDLVLIGLGAIFFIGHGLRWVFIKTKIPDLLILILFGFLSVQFGIIKPRQLGDVGAVLSQVALIVILYEGGLHLHAKDLMKSSLPALMISIIGFILIGVCAFFTVWMFAKPWETALLVALAVGSTSSAIVIPMVKHLNINEKTKTVLSLESAFTDVLTIVLFLVIVDGLASGGTINLNTLMVGIGPNTIKAILFGIVGGILWAVFAKHAPTITKLRFSGEAYALIICGFIQLSGLNGAMGVLALGFTLANLDLLPLKEGIISKHPVSRLDMSLLGELTFLLKTAFFIYLGMILKFDSISGFIVALIITFFILATRFIAVRSLMRPKKYSQMDAMVMVAMGPRGLACAVLATIPMQRGLADGQWIQSVLFALIPITIISTAFFVWLTEQENMRSPLEGFFNAYPKFQPEGALGEFEEKTDSNYET